MNPSNRTLSMMSPKVRQSIMAVSIVTALGMSSAAYGDSMTQRFEADPSYKTYQSLLDSGKNAEALKIKKEMLEKLVAQTFAGYEMSERSRRGLTEKFNSMPLQIKTIWSDLYLKSKTILTDESQRIQFNAGLVFFIDSVHFGYGNAQILAQNILEDIRFNDGGKFAKELVKTGKSADNIAKYRQEIAESDKKIAESDKKIAESDKKIAEWNEVIKLLKKLGQ